MEQDSSHESQSSYIGAIYRDNGKKMETTYKDYRDYIGIIGVILGLYIGTS